LRSGSTRGAGPRSTRSTSRASNSAAFSARPHYPKLSTFLVTLVDRLVSPRGGAGLSLDEQALVGEAIVQTYRRQRVRGEPAFLRDLAATLRNPGGIGGHALTAEQQRAMDSIATRLWQWCERGRYAQLLDRPTNVSLDGSITYVDLGPITGQADLMPVVVLLLQDLIYRQALRNVGSERLIVVQDELWSVLADLVAARFLDDMYRRFRHVGAAILSVSQDMRDFQSPEARAILGNATWWFLLPVVDPDSTTEIAGLNPNQARLLRRLTNRPGEHAELLAVLRLGDHTESGVLVAKPTSLEFWVAASNADERALRERYISKAGGNVLPGLETLARQARSAHRPVRRDPRSGDEGFEDYSRTSMSRLSRFLTPQDVRLRKRSGRHAV
jgi:type IV secretory system conjugative DNA transfer VirD4/TraG family protein